VNLKRESGESLSDFNKRFNHMYNKVPAEVKPTSTSTKLYANAFDVDFCLLLRERRCATLVDMQDATLEVESNIIAAKKLKGKVDRRKQKDESSSSSDPKIDKMTKMIESLTSKISKLKIENQQPRRGRGLNTFDPRNPNPYRRNNEQLHILQRNRNTNEDQKVKAPFQNAVMEKEQSEEDEIHCLEDKGSESFLTLAAYEESLFNDQINQEWDDGVVL